MKVILLGTGDIAFEVFKRLQEDSRIELSGVIFDASVDSETNERYKEQIEGMGGRILAFEEENLQGIDVIFTCEYRKAILRELVEKYVFINCHAGILPKYRGFSANPWAIMNGESQVGYTIHRMDDKLDNGDIFYVGRFPISRNETYADLYDTIFGDMLGRICDILVGIYEKQIHPVRQEERGRYCSRFYAGMGDLKDFDKTSEYIFNLYRCMAKPHGTGVYFIHRGQKYYVGKVVAGMDMQVEDYIGIPGKVVNSEGAVIWVKTQDNIVALSEIINENGENVPEGYFKIGNRLGK